MTSVPTEMLQLGRVKVPRLMGGRNTDNMELR